MQIDWTIVGVIIAVLTLLFTYLQFSRTPKRSEKLTVEHREPNKLLKEILKDGKITVGYFHYPPFVIADNGKSAPNGFFPLLLEQVAKDNSLEVVWKLVAFSDAVEVILKHDVDIIVSIFQTPKRTQKVDFTSFLHSIAVGGVTKNSINSLHSQADLINSNMRIVVCKEEIGHEFAEWIKVDRSRLTIIDTDDLAKIVSYLEINMADVALLDSVSIINFFENISQNKTSLKPIFRRRPLSICLNGIMLPQHEPDLANWLDLECKKARKHIEIRKLENDILEKYHGVVNRL